MQKTLRVNNKLWSKSKGLLNTLVKVLDLPDPYTRDHSSRVSGFAAHLAKRLSLPKKQVDLIVTGSQLHDIGKFGILQEILYKPGRRRIRNHQNTFCIGCNHAGDIPGISFFGPHRAPSP
jgi:HD-GYP domain-containing protein (c-di-GMP phosphodiesterase class II)